MWYIKSIFNNTRYIVFIQTKYHQDLLPEYDVSPPSLKTLLETIWSYRWWHFRSIKINNEDITSLRVYERNFINYKKNVLSKSDYWNQIYNKLNNYKFLILIFDLILYNFVFWGEINKFWKTITNSKPKYLIDTSKQALVLMYWKRMEYKKDKEWKEIIKHIDFNDWKLIINEEKFNLDEESKSQYFLKLLSEYYENENPTFISIFDYIELYEKQCLIDWKDYNYLTLNKNNIKNWYISTINDKIKEKYNRNLFVVEKEYIQIIINE